MPPLLPQDPLAAVPGAQWRAFDFARVFLEVASQPWVVALIALAVYSFLERDVRSVVKGFAPLAIALALAGVVVLAARALGGVPRPVGGGALSVGALVRRLSSGAPVAALAVFATYTWLAYGRRALAPVAVAGALGAARALGGAHWAGDLVGGVLWGGLIAGSAYLVSLRVSPAGHLAELRAARRASRGSAAEQPGPGCP